MESFKGRSFHTFHWPHEPVDMAGKRVAVIGTGATGIQVIGEIADKVGELTVFQRRPNWSCPLNNGPISEAEMADIRRRYDEIFAACSRSPGGFEHEPDRRGFYEVSREERLALWDKLYDGPGFGIWLANFREIFTDEKANAEFSEYIAERIRRRIKDPKLAEKLIPRDHGFGVQRVPMETNYFEAYNRPNVQLVDISETPLVRVTETGLRTTERDYEFDIIVYATGFDAITGAFDQIDIQGAGGVQARRQVAHLDLDLPRHDDPRLPQHADAGRPAKRLGLDQLSARHRDRRELVHRPARVHAGQGLHALEATEPAEQRWTDHVIDMYAMMLMRKAKSWFTGYNSNVPGHEQGTIRYLVYNGGTPKYVNTINKVAANGYEGVVLSADRGPAPAAGQPSAVA